MQRGQHPDEGRAPAGSPAPLDTDIEDMDQSDFADDDLMSVLEEPDEVAEVLVACDEARDLAEGVPKRTNGAQDAL